MLFTRSKTFSVRITAPAARTANATAKTWDYDEENKKKKKKRVSPWENGMPLREIIH